MHQNYESFQPVCVCNGWLNFSFKQIVQPSTCWLHLVHAACKSTVNSLDLALAAHSWFLSLSSCFPGFYTKWGGVSHTGVPSGGDVPLWLTPQIKKSCMTYLKQHCKSPYQGTQCSTKPSLPQSTSPEIHIWQSQELYFSPALGFHSSDLCLCMAYRAAWSRTQHVD